ncbi:hypothetical protein EVAR_56645_1 [Eumeta japonica]|uniref:Uncharacterized protein n=1 Tax=Eumeta variegata TaxID=151549 RepID=A0A4C1YUY1_EUMVA|nr:hypothetical protein EVAR_56645_1 [Eumeta japonica]
MSRSTKSDLGWKSESGRGLEESRLEPADLYKWQNVSLYTNANISMFRMRTFDGAGGARGAGGGRSQKFFHPKLINPEISERPN